MQINWEPFLSRFFFIKWQVFVQKLPKFFSQISDPPKTIVRWNPTLYYYHMISSKKCSMRINMQCKGLCNDANLCLLKYAMQGPVSWSTPPLWRDLVKILTRKPKHASSLSLDWTDLKNLVFEKNPWAPSEVDEVAEVKRPRNPKLWKF